VSKFAGIIEAHNDAQTGVVAVELKKTKNTGKSRDAEYCQVTAYIKKDTYKSARKLLIDKESDFSELVETLLSSWLMRQL